MKRTLAALLLTLSPCFAFSDSNWYGSLFGGVNFLDFCSRDYQVDLRTGFAFSISAGYVFPSCLILEVEGSQRYNSIKEARFGEEPLTIDGHVSSTALLGNCLYSCKFFKPYLLSLTPYFGFGLGFVNNQVKLKNEIFHKKATQNSFAAQVILGLFKKINPYWDVSLEYRFFDSRLNAREHTLGVKTIFYKA